jgi:hypothetical protein
MKVLIDECSPKALKKHLADHGLVIGCAVRSVLRTYPTEHECAILV